MINSPRLNDYKTVVFALDNDGIKPEKMPTIMAKADDLSGKGASVFIVQPPMLGKGYNDILRDKKSGHMALKNIIANAAMHRNDGIKFGECNNHCTLKTIDKYTPVSTPKNAQLASKPTLETQKFSI